MGSPRRRKSRRRASKVLIPLLAVALIAGVAALYPVWRSVWRSADAHPAAAVKPPMLTVEYRTPAGTADAAAAAPQLVVVNTSTESISLADVTLRYYFAGHDAAAFAFNCLQAGVGCSNVTGTIGKLDLATSGADHYLQIGFSASAGTIKPGQDSQGVELQLYRVDHESLTQTGDWSFDPSITTYKPFSRVTGYLRGALVWGEAPDGDSPTGASSSTANPASSATAAPTIQASAAPDVPAATVFDDFHYTGASDPALAAHGWQARTGAGGPGIEGTWAASGVSFPSVASAQGGQALQLKASTDGAKAGTAQAELQSAGTPYFTGTYAARIYFSDGPAVGPDGDHVNESFYPISADPNSPKYSELDNEYMPNGGWGAPGPAFDNTSWYSAENNDRATHRTYRSLHGWHTMMITAVDGKVTYSVDGKTLFTSSGKYYPREGMGIHFSDWFIDLPFTGQRSWDMDVNWFYYKAGQAVPYQDVQQAVAGYYASGTNYIDTLPKS
ncbi:cellulose binding domain-containing protein [Actinospica robiniae]|uniref:cellulose binding domain-containing protein n=1 Tax=Actinospica robiniae TaxID=304901 RepID=UPI000428F845|nr:cellulose binding domain-containing protein [Actinospica robiniae]